MLVLGFLTLVLGAILGSFVACRQQGAFSRCDHCGKALSFWQKVPIISYVVLRGRCQFCGYKIKWQYLGAEVLGLMAAALMLYFWPKVWGGREWFCGYDDVKLSLLMLTRLLAFWVFLGLVAVLTKLAIIDYKEGEMPHASLIAGVVLALTFLILKQIVLRSFTDWHSWAQALEALVILFFPYWSLSSYSWGNWIGAGDSYLAAMLALVLASGEWALLALFITNALALLFYIGKSLTRRRLASKKIAMAPYFLLTLIVLVFVGFDFCSF